jgi:5-methylcytosine-specific restriction protein B
MNAVECSIVPIDATLSRRFHFVPFFPNELPLDGLLGYWLKRHRPGLLHVMSRSE